MKSGLLFIIPPALPLKDIQVCGKVKYDAYIPTSIPIGILSIAAYLKKHLEIDIKLIDFNTVLNKGLHEGRETAEIFNESIRDALSGFSPEIVGISALFNSNYSYLGVISKIVKDILPGCIVIAGGGLPSNLYREVLSSAPCIDSVCFGEGEIPTLELVRANDKKSYLEADQSWITRDKLLTDYKPTAKYIYDLDEIPPLDYGLIDFSEYQSANRYHGENAEENVAISLMTSRGCPFSCCFCASHSVHGKKIRLLSATRTLNDINVVVEKYGVNTVLFEDDHFLVDKKRALDILNGLKDRNLNIEFSNGLAVYAIDESIVSALREAGVKMVTMAVESGSEYVLNNIIHKPLKLEYVTKAVSLLRNAGIYIRAFFMIGLPGETEEHRAQTVQFMKRTGFNWVAVMIATPIAGSELYDICIKNNYLISSNIEDFHFGKGNIKTGDFTPEQIEIERYTVNLDVNFINNYDMINGNYATALIGFNDVIKRVPDHAFAYYCAARCYEKIGDHRKEEACLKSFNEIIGKDKKWKSYAEHFNIG